MRYLFAVSYNISHSVVGEGVFLERQTDTIDLTGEQESPYGRP